uniref:L1 transposable element RRM domain-containing protein n=1 Tax=Poecilia formosa TaxID=48698 RepID=A0A096LZX8_POEFO
AKEATEDPELNIKTQTAEKTDALKGIKEEIKVANSRIDKAESRIEEEHIEEATMELQKRFKTRLVDQKGRSRRENVRIHGLKEGAEDGASLMTEFIEKLLREKLELPPSFPFQIERAHRALPPRPSPESPPRSIVIKFMSLRGKDPQVFHEAYKRSKCR